MLRLAAIVRYPVKSLRGHILRDAVVEPCGIAGDRRWMVVDETGRFVTRREVPDMALIDVIPDADGLTLSHPLLGTRRVARPDDRSPLMHVRIWRDFLDVRRASPAAAAFLSEALRRRVHLVHQATVDSRPIDPRFARPGEHVSLADGYPLLVTTTASLAALNDRLPVPIGMDRFRPNLVIDGALPWDEDGWQRLRIGTVVLRLAKPCSRCVITTQDSFTGRREQGDEPLTTLRAMGRSQSGGIMFGDNAIPEMSGTLRVGDPVEILDNIG